MQTVIKGTTSAPFDVDVGQTVTVTPGSGGSMLVEYTTDGEVAIRNNSATWQAWTAGTVSAETSDVCMFPLYARVTAYTAGGVFKVNGSGNQALFTPLLPWQRALLSNYGSVQGIAINGQGAASRNTRAIQSALDAGGDIEISWPGTIWINDTLIYDSNTQIVLGPQTRIKMVAGIRKPLLRSAAYYRMLSPTAVTLTWSSGMTFSVAWTGHGKIKGDAIWINGATLQAQFKGVFVIETVTDANNVVVRANRLPSGAPTGDVFAVAATQHVRMMGGTWDYNYDGTFATDELDRCGVYNWGVYNVRMNDVRVDSCAKFDYCWLAHKDCGFDQAGTNETDSDIHKIYGPGVHFRGRGIFGECGDDACSMQTREPLAFADYQPYWGDLIDCIVEDIDCVSTTSLAVFYLHAIADGIMDRCFYRNVTGKADNGVRAFTNTLEYSGYTIGATNVQADCTYPLKLDDFRCQRAEFREIHASTSKTTSADQILVDADFYAREFIVEGPILVSSSFTGSSSYCISMAGGADLMTIPLSSAKTISPTNPRLVNLTAASTVRHLVITGANTDADVLFENNATNSPTITVRDSRIGGAAMASIRASCTINMSGNDITNASNGVVRFNATATVNLRTDGTNRLRAGSWSLAPAGTPTLNMYGWDISVDPITVAGANSTNGQFCNSTQAGTEGGPAVRTPAGWVALGTGASGVNTVIT